MPVITIREELEKLAAGHKPPCVSLFMPSRPGAIEAEQEEIRFKNLLREAQNRLSTSSLEPQDVQALLGPAWDTLEDGNFWRRQSKGLAAFLSPGEFYLYRLPYPVPELCLVNERFCLKPLFPLLTARQFFLLALSQKGASLWQGTRFSMEEKKVSGLPRSLAQALRFEQFEKQHQTHTSKSLAAGATLGQFHAQGGEADVTKDRILRYFRQVDRGLRAWLRQEQAPLVLAGVEYCMAIYRRANTYPYLAREGISGNPQTLPPEELHRGAWAIAEPYLRTQQEEAAAAFPLYASRRRASDDIHQVLPEVLRGRVGQLFVSSALSLWGSFDPRSGQTALSARRRPWDEDLLDLATVQTMLHGGAVYPVEPGQMPGQGALAALYRY